MAASKANKFGYGKVEAVLTDIHFTAYLFVTYMLPKIILVQIKI